MKKQIIFLSLIIVGSNVLGDMSEEKKAMMVMVSAHNAAFGAGDLYKEVLKPDDLNKWSQAVQIVEGFVDNYAGGGLKKQLMENIKAIKSANDEMINGIKTAYSMKKFRDEKKDALPFKKIFTAIDYRMQLLQQRLGEIYSGIEEENKAVKFVTDLAKFVGVTARKAGTDLDKFFNQ